MTKSETIAKTKMSNPWRALVVEDEPLVAMMLEDMLEELGYAVASSAQTISEAIKRIEAGGFDFAILDVNLAGAKVFPAALALSQAAIPFAFASGEDSAGLPAEYRTRPVIGKPFGLDELKAALEVLVSATVSQSRHQGGDIDASMALRGPQVEHARSAAPGNPSGKHRFV